MPEYTARWGTGVVKRHSCEVKGQEDTSQQEWISLQIHAVNFGKFSADDSFQLMFYTAM